MARLNRKDVELLEDLIDASSLRAVGESIAGICWEKGEHLRANWQDHRSANDWERAAKRLEVVAAVITPRGATLSGSAR